MVNGINPQKIQDLIDSGDQNWRIEEDSGRKYYVRKTDEYMVAVQNDGRMVSTSSKIKLGSLGNCEVRFFDQDGEVGLDEGDIVGIVLGGSFLLPKESYKFTIVDGALELQAKQADNMDPNIVTDLESLVNEQTNVQQLGEAYLDIIDEAEVPLTDGERADPVAKRD